MGESWQVGIDSIRVGTVPEPSSCDFDNNITCDIVDIDALIGEIVAGSNDLAFDLSADGIVNDADLSHWLSEAATANGFAASYLLGDANLDGSVNAADLNNLGQNWLGHPNAWQLGDFTADGIVNAADLSELGQNWQQSIPTAASQAAVPEPAAATLAMFILAVACLRRPAFRPLRP